jgi:hypothetical protein
MTAEEKYGAALQRALDARAVEPIAAKEDDETSHYSPDHSRDGTLSSSVRADMKANARPVLDRWKVYDQERELSPLASGGMQQSCSLYLRMKRACVLYPLATPCRVQDRTIRIVLLR